MKFLTVYLQFQVLPWELCWRPSRRMTSIVHRRWHIDSMTWVRGPSASIGTAVKLFYGNVWTPKCVLSTLFGWSPVTGFMKRRPISRFVWPISTTTHRNLSRLSTWLFFRVRIECIWCLFLHGYESDTNKTGSRSSNLWSKLGRWSNEIVASIIALLQRA